MRPHPHLDFRASSDLPHDLAASDFDSLDDLSDELTHELGDLTPDDTLTVSLNPPLPPWLSARRACDLLLELLDRADAPPHVTVLVASQRVADLLTAAASPDARRPRHHTLGGVRVTLTLGDVTRARADAIVNASNTRLALGGGVSGAIARAAGPGLQADMTARLPPSGRLAHGDVVVTPSHGLPHTTRILHAATASGTPEAVTLALTHSLDLAAELSLTSLAIPALGAGTGGLPIDRCAQLTHHALSHTLTQRPHPSLREITLVLWRPADLIAFDQAFTHGLEREASDT
jgi:O-acetyl-ADP-ribose deacetylase (regulator of RNase III)